MVSKCANPECKASFRYFHTGKLFRLENSAAHFHTSTSHADPDQTDNDDEMRMNAHVPRLEFFWLCDDCSVKLTLIFQPGVGVSVRPKLARSALAA